MRENLEKLLKRSQKLHVLYVEDDAILLEKTQQMFASIFHEVQIATNGKDALMLYKKYFEEQDKYFDIVITDSKMPVMDGIQFVKNIRKWHSKQLVIVISAYDESKSLIEFINIGVHKFIKKPFSFNTLVEILLDICENFEEKTEKIIINDQYSWNCTSQQLYCNDLFIKLSQNETIILDVLLRNPLQIFSNDDFYYLIRNENYEKDFSIDSIKSMIKRLRKKLPKTFIENIYGSGYRLNASYFLSINKKS